MNVSYPLSVVLFILLLFSVLCGRCLRLQWPGINSWSLRLYFRSLCVAYLRRKVHEQVDAKLFLKGSDGHHVAFIDSAARVSSVVEPDCTGGVTRRPAIAQESLVVGSRNGDVWTASASLSRRSASIYHTTGYNVEGVRRRIQRVCPRAYSALKFRPDILIELAALGRHIGRVECLDIAVKIEPVGRWQLMTAVIPASKSAVPSVGLFRPWNERVKNVPLVRPIATPNESLVQRVGHPKSQMFRATPVE